jgi:hypothetical protein
VIIVIEIQYIAAEVPYFIRSYVYYLYVQFARPAFIIYNFIDIRRLFISRLLFQVANMFDS